MVNWPHPPKNTPFDPNTWGQASNTPVDPNTWAIPANQPAQFYGQPNGRPWNFTRFDYVGPNGKCYFEKQGAGWIEVQGGNVVFTFQENSRGKYGVVIYDPSRQIFVALTAAKQALWRNLTGPWYGIAGVNITSHN